MGHSCHKIFVPICSSIFAICKLGFFFNLDFTIVRAYKKVTKDEIHSSSVFLSMYFSLIQLEDLTMF